ncbi:hypothetical protein TorRG33x02_313450 [Trema orientale]|uniref:Uncharacterized protein n=1 Tax=Trema orientale TaxID=63057 RepID=A0A2P5BPK8_TREOI|nr:hypothetical protein TorRG33x02_313450 [Trema orientale]
MDWCWRLLVFIVAREIGATPPPTGIGDRSSSSSLVEMVMSRAEALTQTQARAQSELGDAASSAESVVGSEQLAEKDAEYARRIDETRRQMVEKEAENQRWLEETQQQLNEQNRMLQTLIVKLGIEMPPPPPREM